MPDHLGDSHESINWWLESRARETNAARRLDVNSSLMLEQGIDQDQTASDPSWDKLLNWKHASSAVCKGAIAQRPPPIPEWDSSQEWYWHTDIPPLGQSGDNGVQLITMANTMEFSSGLWSSL